MTRDFGYAIGVCDFMMSFLASFWIMLFLLSTVIGVSLMKIPGYFPAYVGT